MSASRPSKRISPLSGACVPATHLIRVDLPAPLSPTSAITSPIRTSKSTSVRACTDPNDFVMPRSSRSGVSFTVPFLPEADGGARRGASTAARLLLLAVLLELADADVALLDELVRVEPVDVRLLDHDRRKRDRRLHLAPVRPERGCLRLLALEQRNGRRRGCCRLLRDRLVHRARLPARDDVLRALNRGVLADR